MVPPLDTTSDAWRRQIAIFRAMTGSQRVEMALTMSKAVRELAVAGIRHRHPEWSADDVHDALLERLHGRSVAAEMRRCRLVRS